MISIIIEGVTRTCMHPLPYHITSSIVQSHLTNCHCVCVGGSNSKVGHDSITSFVWMPMVFNQSESPLHAHGHGSPIKISTRDLIAREIFLSNQLLLDLEHLPFACFYTRPTTTIYNNGLYCD